MFKHFVIREAFHNCSKSEMIDALEYNYVDNLVQLLVVLDNFRDWLGYPIVITSGYRSIEHNKRVNGSHTSQHLVGQAIDFYVSGLNNNNAIRKLKEFLKISPLSVLLGQVILYNSFIHIALRTERHKSLMFYDKRTSKQTN